MGTTFRLNADELTPSFLEKVRAMFGHERIRISISREEDVEPRGIKTADLLAFFDSIPYLKTDDAESFAKDIEQIRKEANASPLVNPWES